MTAASPPFGLFERMLASRYLRAKRAHGGAALISVISVIAITLAVFALITTMSVMNGFRSTLLSRILGVNGHVFITLQDMPPDQVARIQSIARSTPGVVRASPLIEDQGLATANGVASGIIVRGISRDDLEHLTLVRDAIRPGGSLAQFQGVDEPTVVIGARLAQRLGIAEGMPINILSPQGSDTPFGTVPRQKEFIVGAVFDIGMAEVDSTFVYMPIEQAQVLFDRGQGYDRMELRLRDPDHTAPVMQALRGRLGPDAEIFDWRAQSQGLADALVVEQNVMRLILMVLVAIAALNVVTGLIMLVKNKSRDIAVLRTLGASKGAITRIFFMASASLGLLGLAAGLLLSIPFCIYIKQIQDFISAVLHFDIFPGTVYSLDSLPAKIDWGEVVLVSIFTVGVTFASTYTTARWASRLDPVEALRYE